MNHEFRPRTAFTIVSWADALVNSCIGILNFNSPVATVCVHRAPY